ncbi:hypothetical protein V6N13_059108 [Hibiscus sabdariffa]|uniref:Uncharacterized protein n=2 Tax=Hibiscus sabdariffa TaxID=183260 RepID=A0ABR1Z950_9ROSI
MVVSEKNRRPRKLHAISKGVELSIGKSRFDALATEDTFEVNVSEAVECDTVPGLQNVVHVSPKAAASSPNSRRVATKEPQVINQAEQERGMSNVVVESMVPGRVPLVIGDNLGMTGQHKAVTIVEEGLDLEGGKRAGSLRGSSGSAKLKLQEQKQSDFKAPNLPLLSEWITSLSSGGRTAKHAPVVDNSASTHADPPDSYTPSHIVHGNGPGGGHEGTSLVQVVDMISQEVILDC